MKKQISLNHLSLCLILILSALLIGGLSFQDSATVLAMDVNHEDNCEPIDSDFIDTRVMTDDFVITVKTNNTGPSSNTQFIIHTTGSGYNYNVDCNNDGIIETTGETGDYTCNYSSAGTYTIRIKDHSGTGTGFPRIFFYNDWDKLKLLTIEQWGTGQWSSMEYAFMGCINLEVHAIDAPNLSNVTSTRAMFFNAAAFNQDISSWNITNITNMREMFAYTDAFNQDISNWNTTNVTNMNSMFQNAYSFNQNISSWNTGKVTDMGNMFKDAIAFNQDIGSWNTANVTNMSGMFGGIGVNYFNQDIGSWNTAKVTNMSGMFTNANYFDQDISNWNTANVTNMSCMFRNAYLFNQDISSWNTGKVTDMRIMFYGDFSTAFDQDIGSWNVTALTQANDMFTGAKLSTENYDALLKGWNAQALQSSVIFSGGNSTYCVGKAARDNMISSYGWVITDGGGECFNFIPLVFR